MRIISPTLGAEEPNYIYYILCNCIFQYIYAVSCDFLERKDDNSFPPKSEIIDGVFLSN